MAKTSTFRMAGAPITSWVTLAFLAAVLVLIALDYPNGTYTIVAFVFVGIPALIAGWFASRKKSTRLRRHAAALPVPFQWSRRRLRWWP